MEQPKSTQPSWIGVVVVVMALLSLAALLVFAYNERTYAECQRNVNAIFLDTLRDRGELFEEDRDAVYDLVTGLVENDDNISDEEALQEFYERQITLDKLLKSYQYPDLTDECK